MPQAKEQFAQLGYVTVTESAANTLTFNGLSVFSNVLTQRGMVIHRVEYNLPAATLLELGANAEAVAFGLSGANTITTIALDDAEVYDYNQMRVTSFGVAANSIVQVGQVIKDFSQQPGGGKLVPADRIYAWAKGTGLANPIEVNARFDFTILELSAQEYLELAQALRVLK